VYRIKNREIWASDIAEYLNRELVGQDFALRTPYDVRTPETLARRGGSVVHGTGCLFITDRPPKEGQCTAHILSPRPELDAARSMIEFFVTTSNQTIHPSAQIEEGVSLGRDVRVGANSVVTADVVIGDGTRILNNVVIDGPVTIGKSCVIKDGAVIGSEGYGFVEDEEGRLIHPPQLGRVLLGDRVWVGSNSSIERAMLTETVVEDDVKIDDLVHVGSGSVIGKKCLITAGSVLAYDVVIGEAVSLGPNVAIREGITVAAHVVVGQGASVVSDLLVEGVYVGVPARLLRKRG
jgi:UDP-3-O-[3-hydroxymyristoyl] glucosamine N-acyltransferase